MPMRLVAIVCFSLCLFAGTVLAEEQPAGNPVEEALKKPPATGLLITFVSAGSQAQRVGMQPGDVLVSYGGTAVPSRDALAAAMKEAAGQEPLECVLVRGTQRVTVDVAPGRLGINVSAVVKDQPPEPLPAATEAGVPWSGLGRGPREVWYAFSLDGENKVGFEHGELRLREGMLWLRHEVAFDGGEQWGLNHQVVEATVQVAHGFVLHSTRYENLRDGWVGLGARREQADGRSVWWVKWPPAGDEPRERTLSLPSDLPVVPSYMVEALASFLPRKAKACLQFRPLNEGLGTIDLPAALYCAGQEEIEQGGLKKKAWKIEQRKLGTGVTSTYWVSDDGSVLRVHYGQAWANATSKQGALAGLPEGIAPAPKIK